MPEIIIHMEQWVTGHFGKEGAVWFWGMFIFATLLLVAVSFILIQATVKGLNNWLQSEEGWKPIGWPMILWASVTWMVAGAAMNMQASGTGGWSMVLAVAGLSFVAFLAFHGLALRFWRGVVSAGCNLTLGLAALPILQFGLCAVALVVGFVLLAVFSPRYVHVR